MRCVLGLLLLVGCGDFATPTDAEWSEAHRMVWQDFYGRPDPLPKLILIRPEQPGLDSYEFEYVQVDPASPSPLNCAGGNGWHAPEAGGQCALGVMLASQNGLAIGIAAPPGLAISSSALAHELWHAVLWIDSIPDPDDHSNPGFRHGGAVERAEQTLRRMGL